MDLQNEYGKNAKSINFEAWKYGHVLSRQYCCMPSSVIPTKDILVDLQNMSSLQNVNLTNTIALTCNKKNWNLKIYQGILSSGRRISALCPFYLFISMKYAELGRSFHR